MDLVGSIKRSVTASQSMGLARPPLTRSAAFFFACCSTKRSSSATQASSAAFVDRFAALSCDRESAERFAGIVDGGGRCGGLSRPLRSQGGGLRDDMFCRIVCCCCTAAECGWPLGPDR